MPFSFVFARSGKLREARGLVSLPRPDSRHSEFGALSEEGGGRSYPKDYGVTMRPRVALNLQKIWGELGCSSKPGQERSLALGDLA